MTWLGPLDVGGHSPHNLCMTTAAKTLPPRTRRLAAGVYEVTDQTRTVSVFFHHPIRQWMAAAEWDQHLYTDGVRTKADAVDAALDMLAEASA
jgi:hypothetical protein